MEATPTVASHHAKLLNFLVDELHANPKDMHIIGHSLGAHIAGFSGRKVKKGNVGRITGRYYPFRIMLLYCSWNLAYIATWYSSQKCHIFFSGIKEKCSCFSQ